MDSAALNQRLVEDTRESHPQAEAASRLDGVCSNPPFRLITECVPSIVLEKVTRYKPVLEGPQRRSLKLLTEFPEIRSYTPRYVKWLHTIYELRFLSYDIVMIALLTAFLEDVILVGFEEPLQTGEQISTPAEIEDRRRPGRNDQVSPPLIPLLRNPTAPLGADWAPVIDVTFDLALDVMTFWTSIVETTWGVWPQGFPRFKLPN